VNTAIILQARMSSSRLPGKALLPVAGYPSAILAALRARNRGGRVILATSDDPSDDVLARVAGEHEIEVFRGPLRDVLARYFLAVASLPEDCIVVRLTADNVVPDGTFVGELARKFECADLEYLGTESSSRKPYGLDAEAFTVAALRKAHATASTACDREHVGPWMERNCRSAIYQPDLPTGEDFGGVRCTIDDQDDYDRVLRLFAGVTDPVGIGWLELTRRLTALTEERSIRGEFTLGTAQLGMAYGVVNDNGKPLRNKAIEIVRQAVARGVTTIDTARAYGDSEDVIGEALEGRQAQVITKIEVSGVDPVASEIDARRRVKATIEASCRALRTTKLDAVLLHDWEHRYRWQGAAWQQLLEFQEGGRISTLGASVYEPSDALEALQGPSVEHLQIPMNILDWRWRAAGVDVAIRERPGVVLHARSAFLQGILLHPSTRWPRVEGFDGADCAAALARLAREFDRESVADLCLAYVRSLPWITSVVVGCETLGQLDHNLRLFSRPKLSLQQCVEIESALPKAPETLLNPSKWNTAQQPSAAYAS